MSKTKKPPLTLQLDIDLRPLSGVGPGSGLAFIENYFPEAKRVIRVASAYFTLVGYKLGREYLSQNTQFQILVGREEGENVKSAVISEILDDLGQCETQLWETVFDLVERMRAGRFVIKDAREMETKFHCKFYICDDHIMWHGSANYTGSGLKLNSEQVGLSRDKDQISLFTNWYDEASSSAKDLMADLIEQLTKWLKLATPFEIYLKTLLLLNELADQPTGMSGHMPIYYQKGVIARALRQSAEYGGALIVAATGLGKTIIGAEIAMRLQLANKINRIVLIAPEGVRHHWEDEFDGRRLSPKIFNIGVLFRKPSRSLHHQVAKLDKELSQADDQTCVIIDEAHFYRNQLLAEKSKGYKSRVYQRLEPVVKAGAKIILLTATAYGTNYQNLNSLLYLLPHRGPNLLDKQNAWSTKDAEEFARLPVVTILGLPHVLKMARDQGHITEDGRTFIQFPNERRYLPKSLRLNSVRYDLPLQRKLQLAFDGQSFEQAYRFRQAWYDDDTHTVKLDLIDTVYNSSLRSWLSSPNAILESLEQNLATMDYSFLDESQKTESNDPQLSLWGNYITNRSKRRPQKRISISNKANGRFNTPLHLSHDERERQLTPLAQKLTSFNYDNDDKLQKLIRIVNDRFIDNGSKIIIFVGRHLTATYLVSALVNTFKDRLRIGCTIESGDIKPKLKAIPFRSEVLRQFSPRSHNFYDFEREYDLLVCTDADAVGVNLQDADTVINYDPPEGADVLFQRAGRVIRMTPDEHRVVHFYTLVPSIIDEQFTGSRVHAVINEIFRRITQRHEKSRRILGSQVITTAETTAFELDSNLDVEQLTRDSELLEDIGGLGAKASISHTAIIENHRTQAEALPEYLLSARNYKQNKRRVFVLVKHFNQHKPLIYNLSDKEIEPIDELSALDLIKCAQDTPRALTNPNDIERVANEAVQAWCQTEGIAIDGIRKICVLYLLPIGDTGQLATLFDSL